VGLSVDPRADVICERTAKAVCTKSQAKSQAKRMQRKTGDNITAYHCLACGHWHVGMLRPRGLVRA
jgi:ribosomal protein L32